MFLTYLPYDPRWDLFPLSQEILDILTTQKFHFLKKGYSDNDPILYRNYGVLEEQAMHIDIGDLTKTESDPAGLYHYLEEVLPPPKNRIPRSI